MSEEEKYHARMRAFLDFCTSLRARTIVGAVGMLVLIFLLYVLPYLFLKLWLFILTLTR